MQLRALLLCALLTGCVGKTEVIDCGVLVEPGNHLDADVRPYNLTEGDLKVMPEIAQAFDALARSTNDEGWFDKECGPWMPELIEELQQRGAVLHGYSSEYNTGLTLVNRDGELYTVNVYHAMP